MSLKNRKTPERQVKLADGENIAVRGLSLTNISEIVLAHKEDAVTMFGRVLDDKTNLTVEQMAGMAESLLLTFPNVAAHIIACATGDSSAFREAADLPASDQIALLKEAGEMTFASNGGMGNVLETVIRLLRNVNTSLAKSGKAPIQQGSMNGFGDYAGNVAS